MNTPSPHTLKTLQRLACAADLRQGKRLGWPRVWLQLRLRISLLVSATLLAAAGVSAFLSKAQA